MIIAGVIKVANYRKDNATEKWQPPGINNFEDAADEKKNHKLCK